MTDDVKGVDATGGRQGGQARTRLARRAVVAAARTLFVERGYTSTSIEAIGDLAEVPQATIYRLFGSKVGILKVLVDTSVAGDDEPLSVRERPDVAARFSEPDPVKLLDSFATFTTAINGRTHDVYRVLLSAAGADPAAAALFEELQQQRGLGQREIARVLHRRGSLRPGLTSRDAVDLVHALLSPEVYRLLVVDQGWPPEKFRRWLSTTLVQQLT